MPVSLTPGQQDDLVVLLARCASTEPRSFDTAVRSTLTPYRAANLARKKMITYTVQDGTVYARLTRDGYWKALALFAAATHPGRS